MSAQPQPEEKIEKKTPTFEFSYWPILVDYVLRWMVFEVWRFSLIPGWLFWICQIAVIPITIIILISSREDNLKKKYEVTGQINVESSPWAALFCLFIIFSGSYITFSLYREWPSWAKWISATLVFIVYGLYILGLHETAVKSASKEDRLKEREALEEALISDDSEIVDANDIRIIRMETEIFSVSQRVDSYTLESALFGALAFSGFLTLISSNTQTLANVQGLITNASVTINKVIQSGASGFNRPSASSVTDNNLLGAVTIETLICSMFFVSVIVSRVRFYEILRRVDYAVRVARTYNNKEDEVYNLKLQFPDTRDSFDVRLNTLTRKVIDAIDNAEPLFRDLSLIARYMWGFRNLGIGSFVLVLLTSAFLVSRPFGVVFIGLSLLIYLYSIFDKWWRDKKLQRIPFFLGLDRRIFRMSRAVKRAKS
jgi:hypothetical protein